MKQKHPKEVARLLAEEHGRVEMLRQSLLERVVMSPRVKQETWLEDVRKRFEHLREHMIKQMSLEEIDGYMSMVGEHRPTLGCEIERLKGEHAELRVIMDNLKDELARVSPDDRLLIRDCCHRIQDLMSFIEHHENDEGMLVTCAFTQDIGGED